MELRGSRLKEVEGRRRRRGVEEAKDLPQKTGAGSPMGDRIKTACLNENTHILEMNMAGCSKEKIVEAGEGTVFGSFAGNELHAFL